MGSIFRSALINRRVRIELQAEQKGSDVKLEKGEALGSDPSRTDRLAFHLINWLLLQKMVTECAGQLVLVQTPELPGGVI